MQRSSALHLQGTRLCLQPAVLALSSDHRNHDIDLFDPPQNHILLLPDSKLPTFYSPCECPACEVRIVLSLVPGWPLDLYSPPLRRMLHLLEAVAIPLYS